MTNPDTRNVFDRALVRRRRERAVLSGDDSDFLFAEVANRMADRLSDVTRRFAVGVDLGSRGGHMARAVQGTGRVERLYATDASPVLAGRMPVPAAAADALRESIGAPSTHPGARARQAIEKTQQELGDEAFSAA